MANPEITINELKALLIPSEGKEPDFSRIYCIFKALHESGDLPSLARALEACAAEDSDINIFWDIDEENDATDKVVSMLWPKYGEAIMALVKEDEKYSDAEVSDYKSFLGEVRMVSYDSSAYWFAAKAVKASVKASIEAAAPSDTDGTTNSKPEPGACALADTNPENPAG